MQRAGFQCLAAIDFNAEAVATFKANFPEVKHALNRDLTALKSELLPTRRHARNDCPVALELIGNPSLN